MVCLPGTTLRILNWRVPELLPTNPTLCPPEHVGQFRTNALPVSVLLHDSASYVLHTPGVGVEFGVHDGLGDPEGVALGVPVGGGHPGVEVGVPVGVALGVPVGVALGVPVGLVTWCARRTGTWCARGSRTWCSCWSGTWRARWSGTRRPKDHWHTR